MIYLSLRATVMNSSKGLTTTFELLASQVYFTGWQALPLITVLALASGTIVIMQASAKLTLFASNEMIGGLLVMIIVREVGPLLTALIVIARSGTAVASEIGGMRVNREIETLEVLGIHPLSYVVFPRLIGGVVSVVCLNFYFVVIALIGGFIVSRVALDMPFGFYCDSLARAFTVSDGLFFLTKNTIGGLIIFSLSCYQGLKVKHGPFEVPQATTRAVVDAVVYVTAFYLTMSTLFYLSEAGRVF